jgi:YHS domain-containing protein
MTLAPTWHRVFTLSALVLATSCTHAAPPERTLTVDCIELIAGRDVPGQPEFSIERHGIEYRFASAQNKAAFEKEPARFEVADGGACGRMGPLSGMGDARRYAVHNGRIFFFASDGCRAGFLKDPALHIETDDDKIFGSNESVTAGRATMDKVVAWAGGADRLRSLTSFRAAAARKELQGQTEYAVTSETAIRFPDRTFQKESWNESWFSTRSGPHGAAMASTRGDEPLAPSRARAFGRVMARWPVTLLKAFVDGAPQADCPGLIVIADGEGTLGERPVEYIRVWLNGAASRLTVDKERGTLLQLAYRGRDGTMKIGDCVRTYTAWATVEGITLPTDYTLMFNAKQLPVPGAKIDRFEINPALADDLFNVAR